jgi:hypothetical protein
MKNQNKSLRTLAPKARVYNHIRKRLYKCKLEDFTIKQKEEFFKEVFEMNAVTHQELLLMKWTRKQKAAIEAARIARGYKRKKKTSLAEYEDKMRDALISKAS